MTVARIARALLPLSICLWAMMAKPALAGQIVGVTFAGGLYSVDPITGNATQLIAGCPSPGCGPYLGASGSPDAGSIYLRIFNLYEINVTTFQSTLIGGEGYSLDLAFDRGTNTLYGTSGSALFTVDCPSPPGPCADSPHAGPGFPTNQMQALGFVEGVGLYGVGDNNLYLVNPSSGVATLIGFTGILPNPGGNTNVTDLAYDPDTGRLIASVGCDKLVGVIAESGDPCDESNPGSIYWIDRFTGHATLLNGDAPQLMGLADVVPEPGSALSVAAGLGALLVWSLRRARTTPGIGSRLRPQSPQITGTHRECPWGANRVEERERYDHPRRTP